jgi:translation initiation factor IF-1
MSESGAVVERVVEEQLSSALYSMNLDGEQRVTAHLAIWDDRDFVRLVVGEPVAVVLTRNDLARGLIVRKL